MSTPAYWMGLGLLISACAGKAASVVDGSEATRAGDLSESPPVLPLPCPEQRPGANCEDFAEGRECLYPHDSCGGLSRVRCDGVRWELVQVPLEETLLIVCDPVGDADTVTCPAELPVAGSPCATPTSREICRYDGCAGPDLDSAGCAYGQWAIARTSTPTCPAEEAPPLCPPQPPGDGQACYFTDQRCPYEAGVSAVCGSQLWSVTSGAGN